MSIYMDNAATSFPKPKGVSDAMKEYLDIVGATINRSVYESAEEVGFVTLKLRERLSRIFNFPGAPSHVVLTSGATMSLNIVIKGLLQAGDHCIVGSFEHNATMRPLQGMKGVEFDRLPYDEEGRIVVEEIPKLIKTNTRLCIVSHASNVSGTLQDARAIGEVCKKHGIYFVLDAAQSAGHVSLDFEGFNLSALCIPGHKGLLGPSGIGALLMTESFAKKLVPIIEGGTGSASDSELTPNYMPDRFEPGTANIPGIYGWEASLNFIETQGLNVMYEKDRQNTQLFLNGLQENLNLSLIGTKNAEHRVAVFSFDFPGVDNSDISYKLERDYKILTRCGLHCSPGAHKSFGTFPRGTVRFSPGFFTSENDIEYTLSAIKALSK